MTDEVNGHFDKAGLIIFNAQSDISVHRLPTVRNATTLLLSGINNDFSVLLSLKL